MMPTTLLLRLTWGYLAALLLAGAARAQAPATPQLLLEGGNAQQSLPGHVFFSPDNQLLALDGVGAVKIYDVATGLPLLQLNGTHSNVAFSHNLRSFSYQELADPNSSQAKLIVRSTLTDSVFLSSPVGDQSWKTAQWLPGQRLLQADYQQVRLLGRRPGDTLRLDGGYGRWSLSADEHTLLTQPVLPGNTVLLTDTRTLAQHAAGILHVPRRLQSAAEAQAAQQEGVGAFRAELFRFTPDGRQLYGTVVLEKSQLRLFRILDLATDSVVFNQAYVPGKTGQFLPWYEPAYYPGCAVVTLPQQADLVLYNLKTGVQNRLSYPTFRFVPQALVTADGGAVAVWNNEFIDVFSLRTQRYIWRSKAGGTVVAHPRAALLYINPLTGQSVPGDNTFRPESDSTYLLQTSPKLTLRRRAGVVIQDSPDGRCLYGKDTEGYALFDENMELLRRINGCTPRSLPTTVGDPDVVVLTQLDNCTNQGAPNTTDSRMWSLARMEPVAAPDSIVCAPPGAAWTQEAALANDPARPALLNHLICQECLSRRFGQPGYSAGRYALFIARFRPALHDTLTLLTSQQQKIQITSGRAWLLAATLDTTRHEILALLRASGRQYSLAVWSFDGHPLRQVPLGLPADLWLNSVELELALGGSIMVLKVDDMPTKRYCLDTATGRYLGLISSDNEENTSLSDLHRLLLCVEQGPALAYSTAKVYQLADCRALKQFQFDYLAVRRELLLGCWMPKATAPAAFTDYSQPRTLALLNWCTGDTLYRETIRNDRVGAGSISPDGRWLAYANALRQEICLVSLAQHRVVARLRGHTGYISRLVFTDDNARLISTATDGTVRIWRVAQPAELASLVSFDADNYLASTPDGYYRCSKGALGKFGYRLGAHAYGAEQFDLRYNRPDKVLAVFGADSALVQGYRAAWQKRVRRAGLTPAQLAGTAPVPLLDLAGPAALPAATAETILTVPLLLADSLAALDRLLVWVNGVALYGKRGLPLGRPTAHRVARTVQVPLGAGLNRLEFAVRNTQGVESYRRLVVVTRTSPPATPGRVYFVGIGVSRYADARHNLPLAAKDVRDLARAVRRRYPTAIIDTLTDARVTRERVRALRSRLLATGLEDRVLLAVAGHGLLDKKLDFYFAPHDVNFDDPARRGIAYDDLDALLDSIPARRRLLLLDACHSGEVDKDAAPAPPATGPVHSLLAATGRGLVDESAPAVGLQNSFLLMQDLFADLSRGSGTQVIAAAAGNSLAYEQASLRNGVFTHCVLDYLVTHPTGSIRVNALREGVAAQVAALTHGAQRPTARAANNEFDWEVW